VFRPQRQRKSSGRQAEPAMGPPPPRGACASSSVVASTIAAGRDGKDSGCSWACLGVVVRAPRKIAFSPPVDVGSARR